MTISTISRTAGMGLMVGLLAVSDFSLKQALAQESSSAPAQQQSGGWRRVGETNPSSGPNSAPSASSNFPSANGSSSDSLAPAPQNAPMQMIPGHLTIQPGTYITVRLNQALSSDHNQAGDAFAATLVRPIVVDGIVVAGSGQTLGGRVTEAKKAGHVEGTSKLGIQLTDLPVVDGQQLPLQAQLIERHGDTSIGRDAAAIGVTTGTGAAIGAAAAGGPGAAIGAGAGLVASTIGVLVTRGHPTILGPETVLTFKIEQPVTISTEHAPQAFRYVDANDYQQEQSAPRLQTRGPGGPGYPPPPAAYYGPGYYPPYPYGYGYGYGYPFGVGFGVVIGGPRYYGGRYYGGYGHGHFH
jgi:hypothetical protein